MGAASRVILRTFKTGCEVADAERKEEEMAPFPGWSDRRYGGPPSCEGLGPGLRPPSLQSPKPQPKGVKERKKQGEGWQRTYRCTLHTLTTGGARSSFTLTNFLLKLPQRLLRRAEARSRQAPLSELRVQNPGQICLPKGWACLSPHLGVAWERRGPN